MCIRNEQKCAFIMQKYNSKSFSPDRGKLLENLVFIALRRNSKELFYFQEKNECDFVFRDKDRIIKKTNLILVIER